MLAKQTYQELGPDDRLTGPAACSAHWAKCRGKQTTINTTHPSLTALPAGGRAASDRACARPPVLCGQLTALGDSASTPQGPPVRADGPSSCGYRRTGTGILPWLPTFSLAPLGDPPRPAASDGPSGRRDRTGRRVGIAYPPPPRPRTQTLRLHPPPRSWSCWAPCFLPPLRGPWASPPHTAASLC